MVRKQQIIKQSVNVKVNVGDSKKKKNGRRRKKGGGGGGGGSSMPPNYQPIHAFTPVYIQSGNPPPDPNPILKAVQDINSKVEKHHMEYLHNDLRNKVYNANKGHIAEPRKVHKVMETQTNLDEIPLSTPYHRTSHHRVFSQPKSVDSLDFEEQNPMFTTSQMFRSSISTPTRDRQTPVRDTHASDSEINVRPTPVRSGRVARPQGSDETDENYRIRMERNRIARDRASAQRRNRNTSNN